MADLQTNNFTEQDLSVIPPGSLNPSGINLNQVDNSAVIDYEGISNSLYLPPIEEPKTLYTQKQAYEEAFYTVGAYSPNPVEDLWMVSQDLMQKGYSDTVELAKKTWEQEQIPAIKQTITGLIEDPSVSKQEKINILSTYSNSGYISNDIKDKYIQKIASIPLGNTNKDITALDHNITIVQDKLNVSKEEKKAVSVDELVTTLHDNLVVPSKNANKKDKNNFYNYLNTGLEAALPAITFAFKNLNKNIKVGSAEFVAVEKLITDIPNVFLYAATETAAVSIFPIISKIVDLSNSTSKTKYMPEELFNIDFDATLARNVAFQTLTDTNELIEKKSGFNAEKIIGKQIKLLGIEKEFEEAIVLKPFKKLGEAQQWVAKTGSEKSNGTISEDGIMIATDLALIFGMPWAFKKAVGGVKAGYKKYKDSRPKEGEILPPEDSGPSGPSLTSPRGETIEGEFTTVVDIVGNKKSAIIQSNLNKVESLDPSTSNKLIVTQKNSTTGIKADSPLDVSIQANPIIGSELALGILEDTTPATAEIFNTTRADVFLQTVLPNYERRYADVRNNPDLRNRLAEINKEFTEAFDYGRFDSNVLQGEKYHIDRIAINHIVNEVKGPYWMMSNSLIDPGLNPVNQTNTILSGNLTFGRTPTFFYNSRKDVIENYTKLKDTIYKLPKELQGDVVIFDRLTNTRHTPESLMRDPIYNDINAPTQAKEFAIEWNFKKEYDLITDMISGLEHHTIELNFPSKDITEFALGKVGKQIFWTDLYPRWVQQSFARGAEKTAYVSSKALLVYKNEISNTNYPKELVKLIQYTHQNGLNPLEKYQIASLFPDLSAEAVSEVFEKAILMNTINSFNYRLVNEAARYEMVKDGFKEGIYQGDKYLGPVNSLFPLYTDTTKIVKKVIHLEKLDPDAPINSQNHFENLVVDFEKRQDIDITKGIFDKEGYQLVQLRRPISKKVPYQIVDDLGNIIEKERTEKFEFALVGKEVVIKSLPETVLPRIKGYAYNLNKGNYFILSEPNDLMINGFNVIDPAIKVGHREAIAIADTRAEATLLQERLALHFPNSTISIRKSIETTLRDTLDGEALHKARLQQAQHRGQELITLDGLAHIEDPGLALINAIKTGSKAFVMKDAIDVLEADFVRAYKEFLPKKSFPTSVSDIEYNINFDEALTLKHKKAVSVFNYVKGLEFHSEWDTFDAGWQSLLHGTAELMDKIKVPSQILKDLGNEGLRAGPAIKRITSLLTIQLNPQKQWFVQTTQFQELFAKELIFNPKDPINAITLVTNTAMIRVAAMENSVFFSKYKSLLRHQAFKAVTGMTEKDFNLTVDAIKKLIPSADLNLLVADMFHDSTKPLSSTAMEDASSLATGIPSKAIAISRSIGFVNAELFNKIGLWLYFKHKFEVQNPGRDTNFYLSPKKVEDYAFEAWQAAGGMSKQGALTWQTEGFSSYVMQFAANNIKTSSLLVIKGGPYTKAEQKQLMITKLLMWGPKSAIPGGGLLYVAIHDSIEDDEARRYFNILTNGVYNVILNNIFQVITKSEDSDIDFASQLSSTSLPLLDVAKSTWYLIDGDKDTEPRVPFMSGVSSILDAFIALKNFYYVNNEQIVLGETASRQRFFEDLASASRGFDNLSKAIMIHTFKDVYTKDGTPYGINSSDADALGKFFGMPNAQEKVIIDQIMAQSDRKKQLTSLAENWHRYVSKEIQNSKKSDIKYDNLDLDLKATALYSSFLTAAAETNKFTDLELMSISKQMQSLDRRSEGSLKDAIFKYVLEAQHNKHISVTDKARAFMKDWLTNPRYIKTPEQIKATEDLLNFIELKNN